MFMQECTVNEKFSLRASPAKSLHCLRNIMRQSLSEELCMHLVLIWVQYNMRWFCLGLRSHFVGSTVLSEA